MSVFKVVFYVNSWKALTRLHQCRSVSHTAAFKSERILILAFPFLRNGTLCINRLFFLFYLDVIINSTTIILSRSRFVYESTLSLNWSVVSSETRRRRERHLPFFPFVRCSYNCLHAHRIKHCFDFTALAQKGIYNRDKYTEYIILNI